MSLWIGYLFMLFAGAGNAALRGAIKLIKAHNFVLLAATFLFALPCYLPWLFYEGMPIVGDRFWWAVGFHVPIFMLASVLMVEAHRSSPLILTVPYLALTPAFLLVASPLINGGTPTWLGALGVLVITVGVYVLNLEEARKGFADRTGAISILDPFRALSRERGSRFMLVVAALYSVTASLDYVALKNSSVPFYLAVDHGLVAVGMALLIVVCLFVPKTGRNMRLPSGRSWFFLALNGVAFGLVSILHIVGLRLITTVPYAIAMQRSGTVIFAVLLGFALGGKHAKSGFEREREHLGVRFVGVTCMLIGMIVILLWGKK